MSAFEPPHMTGEMDKAWVRRAKIGFRDPRRLWDGYWRRFNTITIPLRDEQLYFTDAMAAASVAENKEHLEELLLEQYEDRKKEYTRLIPSLAVDSLYRSSLGDKPRDAILKVGRSGSLDSFLQVLCGVVYDWGNKEGNDDRKKALDSTEASNNAESHGRGPSSFQKEDLSSEVGDPYKYENNTKPRFRSPLAHETWRVGEDEAWNDDSWRVTECREMGDTKCRSSLSLEGKDITPGEERGPDKTATSGQLVRQTETSALEQLAQDTLPVSQESPTSRESTSPDLQGANKIHQTPALPSLPREITSEYQTQNCRSPGSSLPPDSQRPISVSKLPASAFEPQSATSPNSTIEGHENARKHNGKHKGESRKKRPQYDMGGESEPGGRKRRRSGEYQGSQQPP